MDHILERIRTVEQDPSFRGGWCFSFEKEDLNAVTPATALYSNKPSPAVVSGHKESAHWQLLIDDVSLVEGLATIGDSVNARLSCSEGSLESHRYLTQRPHLLQDMPLPSNGAAGRF